MEVEVAQPETSEAESNGEEQLRGPGAQYRCRLSDGGVPDIGDQSAQVRLLWVFLEKQAAGMQANERNFLSGFLGFSAPPLG